VKIPSEPTLNLDDTGAHTGASVPATDGALLAAEDRIGDWVVVRCLGEGGMGAVYQCKNVLSERVSAAVKVLKPHNLGDARQRFIREVDLLASVQHPAVVQVLGGGEDVERGLLYFAMELVDGEDLRSRMDRGKLGWDEARALFVQLADGLRAAHEQGVVHRDIKPENVMLCADSTVRLLDFGIAVAEGGQRFTRSGLLPGTVAYMAPEVFSGKTPDHRADIYALGLMLWEALTGEEAYPDVDASTPQQAVAAVIGQKLQAKPHDPGTSCPPEVRQLVLLSTDPVPARRPAGVARFVEVLGGALQEAGVSLRQVAAETPKRGTWRLWGLAAVISLLLFAVVGVVVALAGTGLLAGVVVTQSYDGKDPGHSPSVSPGWAPEERELPAEFPFPDLVVEDAVIINASVTEADRRSVTVTYTTNTGKAKRIGDRCGARFEEHGFTVKRSKSTSSNGVSMNLVGFSNGEGASCSVMPNSEALGGGLMVNLTYAPPE
jgi:serine/threonine protein kinase